MNSIEIAAALNTMKSEPRYTTVKGIDTEFYVTSFDIKAPNVEITTTIDKHKVPIKNIAQFIALWRKSPKAAVKAPAPTTAHHKTTGAKLEAEKDTTITGAASKLVHITSMVTVYVTKDYKIFRHTVGNRMLNKNKIKKIVSDIKSGLNRLADYPIVVDPATMQVKDGQHRLESAIQTNEQIYYILAKPMELHEIARVNSNTERWKGEDFINCYAEQGNDNYIALADFSKKYGFPMTMNLTMLSGLIYASSGKALKQKFELGQFMTSPENIKYAKSIADIVIQFSKFPGYKTRNFIEAIGLIRNKALCDINKLVEKFNKKPDALSNNMSRKEFLNALELIYNLNAQTRTSIF